MAISECEGVKSGYVLVVSCCLGQSATWDLFGSSHWSLYHNSANKSDVVTRRSQAISHSHGYNVMSTIHRKESVPH